MSGTYFCPEDDDHAGSVSSAEAMMREIASQPIADDIDSVRRALSDCELDALIQFDFA